MSSSFYVNKALTIIAASYPVMGDNKNLIKFLDIATKSLERYPDSVIDLLADPKSGIVTKCIFMPSIADMIKFCDAEMDRRWTKAKREAEIRGDELPPPEHDEEHRKKMRAKIVAEFKQLANELSLTSKRTHIPLEERYGYAPERDFRHGKLGWQLREQARD